MGKPSLYLKNVVVENLSIYYQDVFKDFFKTHISNLTENERAPQLSIRITWMLSSYIICFNVEEKDKHLETACSTVETAEDFFPVLKKLKSQFLSFKNVDVFKKVDLVVLATGKTDEKFLKVVSTYGDALTSFKKQEKKPSNQKLELGGATVSVNLVVFDDIYAAYLLKKILNGYKIDKIVIKNQ